MLNFEGSLNSKYLIVSFDQMYKSNLFYRLLLAKDDIWVSNIPYYGCKFKTVSDII